MFFLYSFDHLFQNSKEEEEGGVSAWNVVVVGIRVLLSFSLRLFRYF
jgi:hypothetical protein